MPVCAVVGAQWGDEGKGRVVDLLAQRSELVVRFQGGNNAGHTVVNEHGTFRLHLLPSGIFNPACDNIIGTGCVVSPGALIEELNEVREGGAEAHRLLISERAQVVMPYHILLDGLDEAKRERSGAEIGTTKRGIGPCYTDKAARIGLQMGDLLDRDWLAERCRFLVGLKNHLLAEVYGAEALDPEQVLETLWAEGQALADRIGDPLPPVHTALDGDQAILLEGQLGALRDIDWGTYPYVTSSSPTAGGASLGAGIPPHRISEVIGVAKAYTTAVGAGPFPAELPDEQGEALRRHGAEFGATTGRPRRCGWFDAVAVRYAARLNGFTAIALTKLDVLDHLDQLQLCTAYRIGDELLDRVPVPRRMAQAEPVLEPMPGWRCDTTGVRRYEDLPASARAYVERVEELVGVPIGMVSVGAERDAIIIRRPTAGLRPG